MEPPDQLITQLKRDNSEQATRKKGSVTIENNNHSQLSPTPLFLPGGGLLQLVNARETSIEKLFGLQVNAVLQMPADHRGKHAVTALGRFGKSGT